MIDYPSTTNTLSTISDPGDERRRAASTLFAPELILVIQGEDPSAGGMRLDLSSVIRVELGRGTPAPIGPGSQVRVSVLDHSISRVHARLSKEHRQWIIEDNGSKNGTYVNGEPITRKSLSDRDLIRIGSAFFLFRVQQVPRDGRSEAPLTGCLSTFNRSLEATFRRLLRIAKQDIPVLIRGETGSGKELVAREIHERSGRPGPFVALNCGALPPALLESELFGSCRGAYSGAVQDRPGLVRHAHTGTLFLDEIAELPLASQAALLRVLQERMVRPLGGTNEIPVDLRVVSATHQNLDERVATGAFRQDLHARLAGFCVDLLPLRQRREDLGMLVAALLPRVTAPDSARRTIQPSAAMALLDYSFPLNIRELEQVLKVAYSLVDAGEITSNELPAHLLSSTAGAAASSATPEQDLRQRLVESLMATGGNVAATGRAFGKAPAQIRRWCHRMGLDIDSFRAS